MKDRQDIGIEQENRVGKPPSPTPSTREVPPTDDELRLIDRLRNADAIGSDGLMLEVMRGRDITKPAVINACMDLIQHQRRMDGTLDQLRKNFAQEQVTRSKSVKDAEDAAGEQIAKLEQKIEALDKASRWHDELLQWRSHNWLYRVLHRGQRPKPAAAAEKQKGTTP